MIQKAIKMTSKGTFTLPAKVRNELGLKAAGDKLMLSYHPHSKKVELQKAPDFAALRAELNALLPGKTPKPLDIAAARRARYAAHRKASRS